MYRNAGVAVNSSMTVDEKLEAAGLNWSLITSPIQYGPSFEYTESKRNAVYRSDTGALLDVATPQRKGFQNRDVVRTFDRFCEASDGEVTLQRLGEFNGGESIFGVAKMPRTIDVAKVGDITEAYIVFKEGHVTGKGLQTFVLLNRLICTNGMARMVKVKNCTMRHTSEFCPDTMRAYLHQAYLTVETYEQEFTRLAKTTISDVEAKAQLVAAFGNIEATEWEKQPREVQVIYNLYKGEGMGSDMLSAFNTLFGLQQACTEFYNWGQKASAFPKAFNTIISGSRGAKQEQFTRQLVSLSGV